MSLPWFIGWDLENIESADTRYLKLGQIWKN